MLNYIKGNSLFYTMNYLVLILILVSSITSSYWNFKLKQAINKGADKILIYWMSYISGVLIYSLLFIFLIKNFSISYQGIFLAILNGASFAIYALLLSESYELSDLSKAFPLSKITPLFTLFIGIVILKETVAITALIGIFLIILGVYCIHLEDFGLRNILKPVIALNNKGSLFALGTAGISAIYGLLFKLSIGKINQFVFIYLSYLLAIIFYIPFLYLKKKNIISEFKVYKKELILIGIFDMLGAILILWALSLSKLSYVFALRQISILFTVAAGVYLFKEQYGRTRIISSLIILVGIILVSVNI